VDYAASGLQTGRTVITIRIEL